MKPIGKFVRDPENYVMLERAQQLNASRGPGKTFYCKRCNLLKQIMGRRKRGKEWVCGTCVEGEKNE